MRYTTNRIPAEDPHPKGSVQATVVGSIVASLLTPALVMAVLYPVAAGGVLAFALAAGLSLAALRRHSRTRRREGHARRFCVPKTGVCVEA